MHKLVWKLWFELANWFSGIIEQATNSGCREHGTHCPSAAIECLSRTVRASMRPNVHASEWRRAPPWPLSNQNAVFALTFLVWVTVHAGRKSYSIVKPVLVDMAWFGTNTSTKASYPDTSFFLFYALGCGFGKVNDAMDPRLVITSALLGAALLLVCLALADFGNVHDLGIFCLLWGLQACVQALAWPGCIAVLGEWFHSKRRAAVMGLWCVANNVGNLLGASVGEVAVAVAGDERWGAVLVANAILMLVVPAVVFLHLEPFPPPPTVLDLSPTSDPCQGASREKGQKEGARTRRDWQAGRAEGREGDREAPPDKDRRDTHCAVKASDSSSPVVDDSLFSEEGSRTLLHPLLDSDDEAFPSPVLTPRPSVLPPVGLARALCTPGVLEVGLSYACLKGGAYAFVFWLPTMLASGGWGLNAKQANAWAMLFDLGSILGSVAVGALAARVRRPIAVYFVSILGSTLPTYLLGRLPHEQQTSRVLALLLLLVGFFSAAPQYLLVTSVAQDLGQSPDLKGSRRAIATMTGVIDGVGSLGAACVQVLVGHLAHCTSEADAGVEGAARTHLTSCDLKEVYYFLTAIAFLGALMLSRLLLREVRSGAWRA